MAGSSGFSIDGLISGMRTGDMIAQLMAIEQRPLTALQNKVNAEQQRVAALRDVSLRIASLQSAAGRLVLQSSLNAKSATVDTPAMSTPVLTATANADAANGSFRVTVSQLATNTKVASSAAIGQAVTSGAKLADAGFGLTPTVGTFTINGQQFTIDADTVLSNGVDAPGENTILAKINNAAIGVTASIVSDPDGRANRLKLTTTGVLQLGAGADSSNFLSAARLLAAPVVGDTAASVTGAAVGAGTIAATSLSINGVTITTTATSAANTAAQNAASLAADINANANSTVTALGNADGTITLTQKSVGSRYVIDVANGGVGTGFAAGMTANGTDREVTSTANLGSVLPSEQLASGRLAVALSASAGSFRVNGKEIAWQDTDTLNTVIGRINASDAGVTATYDATQDKLLLTARATGGATISLEDVSGNFLAATKVLSATQVRGQNALLTIEGVNGGQPVSSASNTVTGVVPGVTLDLKSASANPVTVTVSQDTQSAIGNVKAFVDAFNAAIDKIKEYASYNATTKQAGLLFGDSGIRMIESSLRSMLYTPPPGVGAGSAYRSLADIGLTTGKIGSAVGTTNALTLDESKLTAALQSNPAAVQQVFSAFTSTATLQAGGTGSIASVAGQPTSNHQAGTYLIHSEATGEVTVTFTPAGGTPGKPVTGTLVAGAKDVGLIPGVSLIASDPLVTGDNTIAVSVQSKGTMVAVNDFLKSLIAADGLFSSRQGSSNEEVRRLNDRIAQMQERLDEKEKRLTQKFAAMESALARIQGQSSSALAQLAALSNTR